MSVLFSPVREFFKKGDLVLLALCLLSSGYGLLLIFSATRYNGNNRALLVQCAAIVLGVGGMGADAGGKLTLTLNGKRLHIPFQAFCDWATQNLGAAVEEI